MSSTRTHDGATVRTLRRYPVKSMGGEALASVDVDRRGLVGDRWFAVRDADGRLASGKDSRRFRRRDTVFDYTARTTGDHVEVRGAAGTWRVGEPDLDLELSQAMGAPVAVQPEGDVPHQDDGSISLIGSATLAWCVEQWGIDADPRRLRVNIVVDTAEPFVEEEWLGGAVAIGSSVLRPLQRIPRCRMIDIDQDGATSEGRWLRLLGEHREASLAIYADVVEPGTIAVGDGVEPM